MGRSHCWRGNRHFIRNVSNWLDCCGGACGELIKTMVLSVITNDRTETNDNFFCQRAVWSTQSCHFSSSVSTVCLVSSLLQIYSSPWGIQIPPVYRLLSLQLFPTPLNSTDLRSVQSKWALYLTLRAWIWSKCHWIDIFPLLWSGIQLKLRCKGF